MLTFFGIDLSNNSESIVYRILWNQGKIEKIFKVDLIDNSEETLESFPCIQKLTLYK